MKRTLGKRRGINSILVNAAHLGFASSYYVFIRAIYIVLLAKLLGPTLYGTYSYSQNWYVTLLPLALWGSGELLIRELGRKGSTNLDLFVSTSLILRVALSIFVCLLLIIAAFFFETDRMLLLLIIIFSQGVVVRGLIEWFATLMVGTEKSKYWTYLSMPFITAEVVLGLTLAYLGAEIVWIAAVQVSIWWLQLAFVLTTCQKRVFSIRVQFSLKIAKQLLVLGSILAMSSFLLSWLASGALILYRYLTPNMESFGQVAFVLQAYMIMGGLISMVLTSALPVLSRSVERADSKDTLFVWFIISHALFFGGGLWVVGESLIRALIDGVMGAPFELAGSLIAESLWLLIPIMITHGFSKVLVANDLLWDVLVGNVAGVLTLFVVLFMLIPERGVTPILMMQALGLSFSMIATSMVVSLFWRGKILLSVGYEYILIFFTVSLILYLGLKEINYLVAVVSSMFSLLIGYIVSLMKVRDFLNLKTPENPGV